MRSVATNKPSYRPACRNFWCLGWQACLTYDDQEAAAKDWNRRATPAAEALAVSAGQLWTRHGSGQTEWWSHSGYEARKDGIGWWVLRRDGSELYRHTFLQVVMAHAERDLAARSTYVEAGAGEAVAWRIPTLHCPERYIVFQQRPEYWYEHDPARVQPLYTAPQAAPSPVIDKSIVKRLTVQHGLIGEDVGWQSIETAPKDGTRVNLAWSPEDWCSGEGFWRGGRWVAVAMFWASHLPHPHMELREYYPDPVLWMPFPDTPAVKDKP